MEDADSQEVILKFIVGDKELTFLLFLLGAEEAPHSGTLQ
jgi:hypothetical protein